MMELLGDIRFRCNRCHRIILLVKKDIEPAVSSIPHGENGMGDETVYEVNETVTCPYCGHNITIFVSGSEYPYGSFDSSSKSIDGGAYIEEPSFVMMFNKQEHLLSRVISFCDKEYRKAMATHPCSVEQCTHDYKQQRGDSPCNCIACLEEVHFHSIDGRRTYNCSKLVYCYGCRYLNKFVSEFSYVLREVESIKYFDKYRIISIGCGPAPDLIAFDEYRYENGITESLQYRGFDINEYWKPIHQQIQQYCSTVRQMNARFFYEDAMDYFSNRKYPEANILVLQYVISHFHNTNQFDQLHRFF